MRRTRLLIIILLLILVIPASAQIPAPDGDWGYDNFDYALDTYDFWELGNAMVYAISGSGQLQLFGGGRDSLTHRITHRVNYLVQNTSRVRVRFNISVDTPTFTYFTICGDVPNALSLIEITQPTSGLSIWYWTVSNIVTTCISQQFTGIGGDNTPNDFDVIVYLRKSTSLYARFTADVSNIAYVDYFEMTCEYGQNNLPCPEAPLITVTPPPIIANTPVPRTPTAPVPILLTVPVQGNVTPDCGLYQCGAIDFSFPVLPPLTSPTPLVIGTNAGGWSTQIPLVTSVADNVSPTPLVNYDGGGSDLNEYIEGDGVLVPNDPNTGLPIQVDFESVLAPQNNLFIAYIKGLYATDENYYGSFAPLVQITLGTLTLLMFITGAKIILPIAIILIGLIRKAWGALMDLIPF